MLIFTMNKTPDLIERTTKETFEKVFPGVPVQFSTTLQIEDMQNDKGFTIVLCGCDYYALRQNMHNNELDDACMSAVDNGANFVGFCSGAFYGAEHSIAVKMKPKFGQTYQDFVDDPEINELLGSPFAFVEESSALGPILPYQGATGDPNLCCAHAAKLCDNTQNFHSLYWEGPVFLNQDRTGPYAINKHIVASYAVDYPVSINVRSKIKEDQRSNVMLGNSLPAVLHQQVKSSHRILCSPHPELAADARRFVPAFEKEYKEYIAPLNAKDREKIMTVESEQENLAFLERTLSCLKL